MQFAFSVLLALRSTLGVATMSSTRRSSIVPEWLKDSAFGNVVLPVHLEKCVGQPEIFASVFLNERNSINVLLNRQ
jgi:hypothetical protein